MLHDLKYVYPVLPAVYNTPFFRVGGSGLANCLFVYGKAIVRADSEHLKLITPTWLNFSIGTYLRGQADKRHYWRLFLHKNEIGGLKKCFLLLFRKKSIIKENGIGDFFVPLLGHSEEIRNYLIEHLYPKVFERVEKADFSDCVAVHVRLGDYPDYLRFPLSWYREKMLKYGAGKRILLFSDGSDDEISDLLKIPNVKRAFFGNAIADIVAMSRCSFIIGSNSSFSAWAAFLGQVPCCFHQLQFGQVLDDPCKQIIEEPFKIKL